MIILKKLTVCGMGCYVLRGVLISSETVLLLGIALWRARSWHLMMLVGPSQLKMFYDFWKTTLFFVVNDFNG